MVFTIAHGERHATWVNTAFDPQTGNIQYVYVLPDVVVTVISLSVHARGARTTVRVHYERTSLSTKADDVVLAMARGDAAAGPEWAAQIRAYLASHGARAIAASAPAS
jgi:hypothetical protein